MSIHPISNNTNTYIITPSKYHENTTMVRPKTLRYEQGYSINAQYLPDIRAAIEQRNGSPVTTLYIQHAAQILHLQDVYLLHHRDTPNCVALQSFHDVSEHVFYIHEIPIKPLTESIATTPLTNIIRSMEENMRDAYKHLQQDRRSTYYPHAVHRRNKLTTYHEIFLSVTVAANIYDPRLLQISLVFHHRYAEACRHQFSLPHIDANNPAFLQHHLSTFRDTIIHQIPTPEPTQSAHAHTQYLRAISNHVMSESYIHDILHCVAMFSQHYRVPIQS